MVSASGNGPAPKVPAHKIHTTAERRASRLELLPQEVQYVIFAELTFRERILSSVICKQWRANIFQWPDMWKTLSNEGWRALRLSRLLALYQNYIPASSSVRAIDLTAAHLTKDMVHNAPREIEQVLRMLEEKDFHDIEQATIDLYSYTENWFSSLLRIASNSLTRLTLSCDTREGEFDTARSIPTLVLNKFPNLTYFSFVAQDLACLQVHTADGSLQFVVSTVANVTNTPATQLVSLDNPHQHLRTLILQFNLSQPEAFITPSFFKYLPRLQHLTFGAAIFLDPSTLYRSLFEHCHELESITYDSAPSDIPKATLPIPTTCLKEGNVITQRKPITFVVKGGVISRIAHHLQALLETCHDTLAEIQTDHLRTDVAFYMGTFDYPQLQFFSGRTNNVTGSLPYQPLKDLSDQLASFLHKAQNLRHVVFDTTRISDSILDLLRTFPQLHTLELTNCQGITAEGLERFETSNIQLVIRPKIWMLSTFLYIVDYLGSETSDADVYQWNRW